ncbi:DUF1697 domain-containing protein [Massilia sp. Leaf139]|uniref:DUF1697 domain-containing protein n=1 Tax=Massilia sp. Leaf139 TaxID=1736272 RepID=UPI0006F95AB5|nr:DUF1697 domain-containing protein [Massilia sp. Leaf139]KQQ87495.1 hypothetical protein ASF77_18235 [Massilia sp. Leaf139]
MTSQRYIALIRGINVGRAKRVAMADLRKLIDELGYRDVRSVLNSGNLVFTADGLDPAVAAAAIEEQMVLKFGVAARVMVLSGEELAAVLAENTLLSQATDHARLLVFILGDVAVRPALAPLGERSWSPEALALGQRAVYVWCPESVLSSAAASALGKQLGDNTTSRNWNTLCKLYALCNEPASVPPGA